MDKVGVDIWFYFAFTASKQGKTGLSITAKAVRKSDATVYTLTSIAAVDATNLPGLYAGKIAAASVDTASDYLAMASTADSTVDYQHVYALQEVKSYLGNLDATVSSRSTYAGADTSGTTTLLSRLTSGRATNLDNLDATVSSRSTYAGADTAGTTTLLTRLTNTRATNLDNLDATVSSRSTYAGGDTSGVTTLLTRLSAGRALNLDNLDTTISSRSTYAGTDTAGTTTLLGRVTNTRATNLDNLDATISSRAVEGDTMALDMAQTVPTSNTAQTLGDALNAARAQGFGKWVIDEGTATLTLYAHDGTTVIKSFALGSTESAIVSRTEN